MWAYCVSDKGCSRDRNVNVIVQKISPGLSNTFLNWHAVQDLAIILPALEFCLYVVVNDFFSFICFCSYPVVFNNLLFFLFLFSEAELLYYNPESPRSDLCGNPGNPTGSCSSSSSHWAKWSPFPQPCRLSWSVTTADMSPSLLVLRAIRWHGLVLHQERWQCQT